MAPTSSKAEKASARQVLDAAIGLTSLGSPKSSPSPETTAERPPAYESLAHAQGMNQRRIASSPRRMPMPLRAGYPTHAPVTSSPVRSHYPTLGGRLPMPSMMPPPMMEPSSARFRPLDVPSPGGRFSSMAEADASYYDRRDPVPRFNMTRESVALPNRPSMEALGSAKSFPETLFDIVDDDATNHIVSWLPHGKGFAIHDKQRFGQVILPAYFEKTKYTSFTRRLKRWNFTRVARGPEMGSYYNPDFHRDKPHLVQKMRYRMEGQFAEAKEEADKTQDEKMLEEMLEKEAKARAAEEESTTKAKRSMSEDARPMPNPSMLPRKKRAKTAKAPSATGPGPSAFRDYTPSSTDPSVITPNDVQRELLLTRTMLEDHRRQHDFMASKIMTMSSSLAPPLYNRSRAPPMASEPRFEPPRMGGGMMRRPISSDELANYARESNRPIMMSRREQEEFAEYLYMKRRGM